MPLPVIPIKPPYKPEILAAAVEHMEVILSQDAKVFEFGSGASTVWFAQRARCVVSVEHEPLWAEETTRALVEAGVERGTVLLVPNEEDGIGPAIDRYGHFDLILVDCLDRQRVSAICHAMPHVKPGGYVVVDDSHWGMLKDGLDMLEDAGWERTIMRGMHWRKTGTLRFHQTSFYRRPDR